MTITNTYKIVRYIGVYLAAEYTYNEMATGTA